MGKFDFDQNQITIMDAGGQRVDLSPQEALELLYWLSKERETLLYLASSQAGSQQEGTGQQVEILIQQEQQVYLDALKAAIPQLQQVTPAISIFVAPADTVQERALQLLNANQIEYHIHPLLEDDHAFTQD